jgi:acetyl esterase
MPLDRRAKRLLDMLSVSAAPVPRTTLSRREGFAKLMQMGARTSPVAVTEDFQIDGPETPMRLRLYDRRADRKAPAPALVFLHGGGLVAGSIDTHDAICRGIAQGFDGKVISVAYRLAPEWPFPAALDDAAHAVRWASTAGAQLGIDPGRVAVGGESAGAMLAALIANGHARGVPAMKALLMLCPVIDLAGDYPSRREFAAGFLIDRTTLERDIADCLGEGRPATLLPSPLRHGIAARTPPAVIVSAECDPFRDEAQLYAEMLEDAGVTVRHTVHAGMVHSFYGLGAFLPQALPALKDAGQVLNEFLGA